MPFSYSKNAGLALENLMQILRRNNPPEASNAWWVKTEDVGYYHDIDRIDQNDSGIQGKIFKYHSPTSERARHFGSFRIDGEGIIHSFPGSTIEQQRDASHAALNGQSLRLG